MVGRIDYNNPSKIIDIGCGPGNSSQILVNRWPNSDITGADNSPTMIKKASNDFPNPKWIIFNAGDDKLNNKYGLIFCNATIQWIPDHNNLLKKFVGSLNDFGILAVQLPLFFDMPIGKSILKVAELSKWKKSISEVRNLFTIHNASYYYDKLSKYFSTIDIWTTDYYHTMESHFSIIEMIRTTGLKPYLERLSNENDKQEFETFVFKDVKRDYPLRNDGKVLFPFKRLFFIARK